MVWNEDSAILLSDEFSENVEILNQIVSFSIEKGIFSNKMYEEYNILTSRRIQENFYKVAARRKTVDVRADFVIFKPLLTLCKHDVNTNKKNVNIMSTESEEMYAESDKVEEKRVEENRVDIEDTIEQSSTSTNTDPKDNNNSKFYEDIVKLYNSTCKALPPIKHLTKKRKQSINARLREYGQETVIEMIKKAGQSYFLSGQNKQSWTATFDWLFKPNNFIKVLEGNYDSKENNSSNTQKSKIIKPNKFHNFEQRTEKYSAEQLDEIARRNFEKKTKELGLEG